MKHSKPLAYIRQLCCLGLAKETMILELLRAFKVVIRALWYLKGY